MDWYQNAVVYQIYPRSFKDTNSDGIGDLRGIQSKLPYLKSLGIDALWLCPFYPSPNDDNGYDVSDYLGVHEDFGTLADFEELAGELRENGIHLILDMVLNHSSDEHPWFQESKKSASNPYSDYYIWHEGSHEGTQRTPPNNWTSIFGGSAWEWCDERKEFYLHLFSKKQPDFNWENPRVRAQLTEIVRTWAERGVDGFRLDVINFISKKAGFPDVPGNLLHAPELHYTCGPRLHEYLRGLHQEVFQSFGSMSVGETPGIDPQAAALYCAKDRKELDMIFHFEHTSVDHGAGGIWDVSEFRFEDFFSIQSLWQEKMEEMGGWNSLYLENHDQSRFISRICPNPQLRERSSGVAATLLLTLKGTPYIYQGQEISMDNVAFESIDEYQDIWTLNHYREAVERGDDPREILKRIHYRSRDNSRTPMQWDDSKFAGFSAVDPWIRLNPNSQKINVSAAEKNSLSVLHTYRKLIGIKKEDAVLQAGKFKRISTSRERVFAYTRELGSEKRMILLNFSEEDQSIEKLVGAGSSLLFSSWPEPLERKSAPLRPFEGRIYIF